MNRSFVALLVLPVIAFAAPVPKVKDASKLLVLTDDRKLHLVSDDGTDSRVIYEWGDKESVAIPKLSPDRKTFAFLHQGTANEWGASLMVRGVDGTGEKELTKLSQSRGHFWSADGKCIIAVEEDSDPKRKKRGRYATRSWIIDASTGEKKDLEIDGEYKMVGLVPGTDQAFCQRFFKENVRAANNRFGSLETVTTGTDKFEPTVVIPEERIAVALAAFPGGKRFLTREETTNEIGIYDTAGKTFTAWKTREGRSEITLSPDGRSVAFVQADKKGNRFELHLADSDGTNARKVWESSSQILNIDWR